MQQYIMGGRTWRVLRARVQSTLFLEGYPLEDLSGTDYRSADALKRHCRAACPPGRAILVEYVSLTTGRRYLFDSRHRNNPGSRDVEVTR